MAGPPAASALAVVALLRHGERLSNVENLKELDARATLLLVDRRQDCQVHGRRCQLQDKTSVC